MKLDRFIIRAIVEFPNAILVFFVAFSIGAALLLPGLQRDPTPYLLPPSHESRVNLAKLRQNYTGANDSIIILLEAKKTVFNKRTLLRIKKMTAAFENIHLVTDKDREELLRLSRTAPVEVASKMHELAKGHIDSETWMRIDEIKEVLLSSPEGNQKILKALDTWMEKLSPVIKVTSLANTDNILGANGKLTVNPVFDEIPQTKEGLLQLEKQVQSNDLFKNILFSKGGKSTSIIIELGLGDDETQNRYLIYQQVKNIVENLVPGDEKEYIAGLPVVTGALGKVMEKDTQRLFPIVIFIVVASLFITFRQLKGVFVPLFVVLLSLIITLGLMVLFKIPLNIITTTLPVFILSIGVADGIHIFSEYRDNLASGYGRMESIEATLKHLTIPVIMTSLTTAVAFYAISMTRIIQLKHFGIFVSIGTIVAMLFSLFFIPALLVVLPEKNHKKTSNNRKEGSRFETAYADALVSMTKIFVNHPALTSFVAGIIFIVSIFGASKVLVDNNNAKYFLKDSTIYISTEKLNKDAAGSSVINLLIKTDSKEKEPFKNPENLKYVEELAAFVKTLPKVGKVLGLTELIKRINFVLNDEDPAFNRVPVHLDSGPGTKNLISQLLLLYENGGGDALSDFTDSDYRKLNIPVILQTNSSLDIYRLSHDVKEFAAKNFPDHLKVDLSGSASVSVAATDEIVSGQMISMIVSLGLVLIMLVFTFKRLSYATIAMVPLVMTISINFSIMGFFGIPLNIGTAIISSIVIGIGVDYSIHYLSRLKKNLDMGMDFSSALNNTVRRSGKAIVSNAFTVGLGFVALWFSILTPLIIMGWMITVTMLVSAVSTLALIPVLIIFVEKRANMKRKANEPRRLTLHPQQG
ncbi:MAG: RND family transporter [Deltaproteobacteria bacterium]|nr:RND family transporter [Deltaproteobacteria bacterium]